MFVKKKLKKHPLLLTLPSIADITPEVNSKELIIPIKNRYTIIISFELGCDCMADTKTAVRARILDLCAQRQITVNRLATISGVTQSTLNNIISGRNNSVTVSTIKKLCDGLDISLREFFDVPAFDDLEQEIK